MWRFVVLVFVTTVSAHAQVPVPDACAGLLNRSFVDTKIVKATQYAAKEFPTPAGAPESMVQAARLLPALCRVVAELMPTTDSGDVKMTRPLCPYPQVARYKGTGDTNKAESFVCAAGSK